MGLRRMVVLVGIRGERAWRACLWTCILRLPMSLRFLLITMDWIGNRSTEMLGRKIAFYRDRGTGFSISGARSSDYQKGRGILRRSETL
jgi:hypothetical protein